MKHVSSVKKKYARKWLQHRLLQSLLVICLVAVLVFLLIRLVPGDPAVMVLGEHANPEELARLHEKLNLNLPIWEQFYRFVQNLFLHGDTGESIRYGISCREIIFRYAPVTLLLVFLSFCMTAVLTLVLAFTAALHRDSFFDHVIRIFPVFTQGMPVFWIGLLFILFFSVRLGWFPVGGMEEGFAGRIHSLLLPAVTIAFGQVPPLVRSLRERLLEVLDSDFVVMLRASGIPKRSILLRHVLRNAIVPTLMLLGVNLSYLIGGTLVVEQVFAIRGIGNILFDAISCRDFPLVQGIALYCAVFVVLISFLTELVSHIIDPRTAK